MFLNSKENSNIIYICNLFMIRIFFIVFKKKLLELRNEISKIEIYMVYV